MLNSNYLNNQPLITIITVVYNGEKHLEQTIQSVIDQTYDNIEYIIIDGGSTDKTLDIIKKNKKHIRKWISEADNGLYDAMNKGISLANGELIGMINSDDWYEPDCVEIMIDAYIKNQGKCIFHADRYDVNNNGKRKIRKFHPSIFKFKYYGMTYNHPSMFITKREYSRHLYNVKLSALSDYQFVLEAFLINKDIFVYIDEAIVNYRLDGISANLSLTDKLKEGFISRKDAGMNVFENAFSFCFRLVIFIAYSYRT